VRKWKWTHSCISTSLSHLCILGSDFVGKRSFSTSNFVLSMFGSSNFWKGAPNQDLPSGRWIRMAWDLKQYELPKKKWSRMALILSRSIHTLLIYQLSDHVCWRYKIGWLNHQFSFRPLFKHFPRCDQNHEQSAHLVPIIWFQLRVYKDSFLYFDGFCELSRNVAPFLGSELHSVSPKFHNLRLCEDPPCHRVILTNHKIKVDDDWPNCYWSRIILMWM
jgi:hypothetical protein